MSGQKQKTLWPRPDTTPPGALQDGEPNRKGGGHYQNQQCFQAESQHKSPEAIPKEKRLFIK